MVESVSRLTTAVHSLGFGAINIGGGGSESGVRVGVTWLGRLMGWTNSSDSSLCLANCSGHGECMNGTCFCEVQFDGVGCSEPNFSYHVAFASVFLLVAATSLIQLFICIHAEYARLKAPSILKACRITTQKLLYVLVFLAALLRGLYFAYPATTDQWSASLLSAYYPVLLSGASLIVCFWAEVFHLPDMKERPRFLSKSFLAFLAFNVITYSLLVAELVITNTTAQTEDKSFYSHVFNGCYAVLMFIVVVFFLIYGVEVYFKVRGGFLNDLEVSIPLNPIASSPSSVPPSLSTEEDKDATVRLVNNELKSNNFSHQFTQSVDVAQLHQSRLGLVSQAAMLIITVCFLFSDILGEFWKKKVPLESRNTHDVLFRIVELGVALWFPCVLWNCMRPEQLWILNPKKILKRLDIASSLDFNMRNVDNTVSKTEDDIWDKKPDCWICYDGDRTDAGPMLQPCACKGDVGTVHHECLKRWLIESSNNPAALICKVCQTPYQVEKSHRTWSQLGVALTPRHWLQTTAIVLVMCGSIGGASVIIKLYQDSGIRLLAVGAALLIVYVCFRFLGLNTFIAYKRAKVSSFKIVNQRINSATADPSLPTISQMITVEVTSRPDLSASL